MAHSGNSLARYAILGRLRSTPTGRIQSTSMSTPPQGTSPSPTRAKRTPAAISESSQHSIGAEDLFSLATRNFLALSPDGSRVAFCESSWDDQQRRHSLQIIEVEGRGPRVLFEGTAPIAAPQWDADGRGIFFAVENDRVVFVGFVVKSEFAAVVHWLNQMK